MYACLECGKRLPRAKEKGHREREYCSAVCRQRAWRARNKDKHNLDRIIQRSNERMWNSIDQNVRRETWQDELRQKDEYIAFLDQHIQFLNKECEALEAEIAWLKLEQGWKEEHMANQDAEIARLNALLNPTRPRRPRPPDTP